MSHAYVARLKREPITSVTFETIQAMAIGLDLPERTVATAALESMGVHDIGTAESGAAVAIARDPDLTERDRRILLAVVREMQGEHNNETADPPPTERRRVEDSPQPDGVTRGAGQKAARARWDAARRKAFSVDDGTGTTTPSNTEEGVHALIARVRATPIDHLSIAGLEQLYGDAVTLLNAPDITWDARLALEAIRHDIVKSRGARGESGNDDGTRLIPARYAEPGENPHEDPAPWEQDDFDMAAKRGRNRGREARQQQDRDAEDGGA